MIKLTIIIPHYNSVKSLYKLLDSIPKKEEIQVIVIDDKSDNELEEYINMKSKIQYSHITFIENNTNKKGAGVCRNIGLYRALGEWILFADSDDYFTEEFYEKVKKYLSTDNDVIYFIPTSIEQDTGNISDRHLIYEERVNNYLDKKDLKSELYLKYHFVVPWSKLIRRNLITKNNITFDETIVSNDIMFSTKVSYYMNKFDVSRDVIYCATRNRGSLTTKISQYTYNIRLDVFIDYCRFVKSKLNQEEYYELDLCGIVYIINSIKYKLGLKTILKTLKKLRKNNINILGRKHINLRYISKKIIVNYKDYKKNKRYLVKG